MASRTKKGFAHLLFVLILVSTSVGVAQAPWPTEAWLSSTPEAQGMDSERLAEMFDVIAASDARIHSLLVIRNGYVVTEANFYPYRAEVPHELQSVTKSVTSALVGVAVAQGYLESVHQPLLSFFPDREIDNLTPEKRAITLAHLLTMTSGLHWTEGPYGSPLTTFVQMQASADWTQFMLDLPVVSEPGSTFNYSSGNSHLLSAVLREATGERLLEFAQSALFRPLGITRAAWFADPTGLNAGGFGLSLTPRALAKIGYLYLRGGVWDGARLLPEGWVEVSTWVQVDVPMYGYGWWLDVQGLPMAKGTGGQGLMWVPDLELVAVVTAGNPHAFPLRDLLYTSIMPAVLSEEPLPENPEGLERLREEVRRVQMPDPKPVELPVTARRVSGNVYRLEEGAYLDTLSLRFSDGEAQTLVTVDGRETAGPVGLGNCYRFKRVGDQVFASRGYWRDKRTFVIEEEALDGSFSNRWHLTFNEANLNVFFESLLSGQTWRATGWLIE